MEKITIDNYEIFYLDFLEGSLSKEDAELLLHFLKGHPELKLDSEDLPILGGEDLQLTMFEKELLKKQDLNALNLNLNSAELLLIADQENLLGDQKQKELSDFIESNTELIELQKRYKITHLHPDLTLIYPDKKRLKKKSRIIPLWSYGLSVAAASIALFVIVDISSEPVHPEISKNNKVNSISRKPSVIQGSSAKTEKTEYQIAQIINTSNIEIQNVNLDHEESTNPFVDVNTKLKEEKYLTLGYKKLKRVYSKCDPEDLEVETNFHQVSSPKNTQISGAYGFSDMENPIQPITKRLSEIAHREVDFRRTSPKDFCKKGFYFKFGKIEIFRRKQKC